MATPRNSATESARLDRVLMAPRPLPRTSLLSLFAPYLRLVFPVLAVAAVAVGLIWPLLFGESAFRLSSVPVAERGASYMRMSKPHFTGSDGKERTFNVTAEAAVQQKAGEPLLDLTTPRGDLISPEGSWMALSANLGRFDQTTHKLDLTGKVELLRDDGYHVSTERAAIDMRAGVASGDAPVAGHGPAGNIKSEGFRIGDRGKIIEFTGKAHLVLHDADQLPTGKSGDTQ